MTVELPALTTSHRPAGWCSLTEAATTLGVHKDTVRRMIDRGDVYAERVGPRLIRVDLASIQREPLGPPHGLDFEAMRERALAQLPDEMVDPSVLAQLDRLIDKAEGSEMNATLCRDRAVDERIAAGADE